MGINMNLFVSDDPILSVFDQREVQMKMCSLLNVSNGSSKAEEFSLNHTEVLVDNKEQNWFKRAPEGNFLGLVHIQRPTVRQAGKDKKTRLS